MFTGTGPSLTTWRVTRVGGDASSLPWLMGGQDVYPCKARSHVVLGWAGRHPTPARRHLLRIPAAAWARLWIAKRGAPRPRGSPCFGINRQVVPVLLFATRLLQWL